MKLSVLTLAGLLASANAAITLQPHVCAGTNPENGNAATGAGAGGGAYLLDTKVKVCFATDTAHASTARCGAYATGSTPTVAEVMAANGTGFAGSAGAAESMVIGVVNEFELTSLTAATSYDVYCVAGPFMSTKLVVTTHGTTALKLIGTDTNSAATDDSRLEISKVSATKLTIKIPMGHTTLAAKQCKYLKTDTSTTKTASQIYSDGNAVNIGGTVAGATALTVDITGMTKGATSRIWVACDGMADGDEIYSTVTNPNDVGVAPQSLVLSNIGSTSVTVKFNGALESQKMHRCCAALASGGNPSKENITAGASPCVGSATAEGNVTPPAQHESSITGLSPGTQYKVHCRQTDNDTMGISDAFTTGATLTKQYDPVIVGTVGKTKAKVAVQFFTTADTSTRCCAYLASAAAPNAGAIMGATGAEGTCQAADDRQNTNTTPMEYYVSETTGLKPGTAYKMYCAQTGSPATGIGSVEFTTGQYECDTLQGPGSIHGGSLLASCTTGCTSGQTCTDGTYAVATGSITDAAGASQDGVGVALSVTCASNKITAIDVTNSGTTESYVVDNTLTIAKAAIGPTGTPAAADVVITLTADDLKILNATDGTDAVFAKTACPSSDAAELRAACQNSFVNDAAVTQAMLTAGYAGTLACDSGYELSSGLKIVCPAPDGIASFNKPICSVPAATSPASTTAPGIFAALAAAVAVALRM